MGLSVMGQQCESFSCPWKIETVLYTAGGIFYEMRGTEPDYQAIGSVTPNLKMIEQGVIQ